MEIEFEDWKKQNPNGSLNDFYAFARKNNAVVVPSTTIPPMLANPSEFVSEKEKLKIQQNMIIGIVVSVLGGIGFFAPWFSVPIFNLSVSGNEISQLANLVENYSTTKINIAFINYIYIIPVSYAVLLLGTLTKSYVLTILSGIINLVAVGFVLAFIFKEMPNAMSMMSFGLYMIITSWFFLLYYLITNKF